jgi:hypothetical protein
VRCRACDRLLHWIIANTHYALVIPAFASYLDLLESQCSNLRHLHWTDYSGIQQHSLEASVTLPSPLCFPCLHHSKQTSIKLDFLAENYVKLPSSMHGMSVTGQRCMSIAGKQFNFICPWFCSKLSHHQMFPEMRGFVTL